MIKPLSAFLAKRSHGIETNIQEAEQKNAEAETVLTEQKESLKNAHVQAQKIRKDAEEASSREYNQLIQKAKDEYQEIVQSAKKDIISDYNNAQKILKDKLGLLAIDLSEKLIQKNLDKSTQEAIISEFLQGTKN